MEVVRWTPFREFEAMERRMRRFFEDVGFTPMLMPAADVYETEKEYVVELEVPGYEEKELEIEVIDHTLRVKGERMETKEEKDKAYRLHERLEKTFERRFVLPVETDTTKVEAKFAKGLLEIHVGKTPEPKPLKIAIGKG
jgi:HSP20 family protein